jgi:hypothetical protein
MNITEDSMNVNIKDIVCIGFQEGVHNMAGFFLYQDLVTRTSFTTRPGETLQEACARVRQAFQAAPK